MGRVNITVGIRSITPTEVRPGVARYTYKEYPNVSGQTISTGYQVTDNQSIVQQSNDTTRLSFIMPNDPTDRLGRIMYVIYLGTKWKVTVNKINRPRVEITLGSVWTGDTTNVDN